MINRGGPSLVVRIADQTGATPAAIAFAFAAVRDSYDMPALNDEINALDGKVAGQGAARALRRGAGPAARPAGLVPAQRRSDARAWPAWSSITATASPALTEALDTALPKDAAAARAARGKELIDAGVPEALARRIADLPELAAAPDVVLVADRTKKPIAAIVATYFAAEALFPPRPRGGGGARASSCRTTSTAWRSTARSIRSATPSGGSPRRWSRPARPAQAAVEAWVEPRKAEVERIRAAIHQIAGSG